MKNAVLFASDLDNTLIHSYRTAKAGDICVETRAGKELSFMSRQAYALLKEVAAQCVFVPVTTRSLTQYRRLDLGVSPSYAIAAHGAVLLKGGEIDEPWRLETRASLNVTLPTIDPGELLFDVRYVEEAFIFAKSDQPRRATEYLKTVVDGRVFQVCAVHNKVYLLPAGLDKGTAVSRLRARLAPRLVICAGDSELDLPMLRMADIAIAVNKLDIRRKQLFFLSGEDPAFELLGAVNRLLRRQAE
jgi:hydroxymethylpyrimidine pyrophosphatase-like HAD family hydrolase